MIIHTYDRGKRTYARARIDFLEGNRGLDAIIDTVLAPHVKQAAKQGRAIMNKEHDRDKQITRERFLGGD